MTGQVPPGRHNWWERYPPPERPPAWPEDPRRGGRVRWVASAPRSEFVMPAVPDEPYSGPPAYPAPPRWGFPNLAWRSPTMVPGTASAEADPRERQRVIGAPASIVLLLTGVVAAVAASAELWRYLLLVRSRDAPLNSREVAVSDVVVELTGITVYFLAAVSVILAFWWLVIARSAVAKMSGTQPSRTLTGVVVRVFGPWALAALVALAFVAVRGLLQWLGAPEDVVHGASSAFGVIAPPVVILVLIGGLVMTGPVIAELEHDALRRPRGQRPHPSKLVRAWWAVWVVNPVLAVITLLRRAQDGVQAEADGVLLTALTAAVAATLAILTGLLIRRLMAVIAPQLPGKVRRMRVVTVRDAPEPPLRRTRPVGASR